MNARRVLLALGLLAAVAGIVIAFAPGLVAGLSFAEAAITVVGVVALLAAYLAYRDARATRADAERADPPDVETRRAAGRPGKSFDRTYAEARTNARASARPVARDRLHDLAVETLVAIDGLTEEAAESRLREGTWTDDPHAAAFFADDAQPAPTRLRLRELLGRASVFDVRFRHALAEIERIAGLREADDAGRTEEVSG
ncbi:DUF7269 family protein [Halarchaeum sp. P4]|uniref:DUF7269 family protein n=1 Tax=Halarchaeum sp. P4 TaxID=3421639 RepID=UPI003EC022E5